MAAKHDEFESGLGSRGDFVNSLVAPRFVWPVWLRCRDSHHPGPTSLRAIRTRPYPGARTRRRHPLRRRSGVHADLRRTEPPGMSKHLQLPLLQSILLRNDLHADLVRRTSRLPLTGEPRQGCRDRVLAVDMSWERCDVMRCGWHQTPSCTHYPPDPTFGLGAGMGF